MVEKEWGPENMEGPMSGQGTNIKERRVGDERVEAIARELNANTARLANIEATLVPMQTAMQDLAKAMVSVARVEERLAASHEHQQNMAGQICQLQRELRELTRSGAADAAEAGAKVAAQDVRGQWLERAFWIGVTIAAAYIANTVGVAV